ncbi:polysaccharide deacetylase [Diplodia corticola]|uniref:Polysaccharide deacetylase n=1 Tax=Diplodia corticola TaxID=236234 RepID=A0A1J9RB77_9PEZI|nr:polysaccharide deacetylase [Diplodia corticola]OJD29683.1 polysaccharide deacetylase [Diplodia corticola]
MSPAATGNALTLWRAFCGLCILASLTLLSLSGANSAEPFPHYQNPRNLIARRCRMPGVAALTFDDFPNERIDELLELLAAWNATATFFVNGPYDARAPMLQDATLAPRVKKMHSAGHQIASHTRGAQTRLDRWLASHLGISAPRFMRAPYGECNATCALTLTLAGYKVVGWGMDTEDWKHNTPETVHRSVFRVHEYLDDFKARELSDASADIVLMHAFPNTTVTTVAPAVLEAFGREGFRFVSVAEFEPG